MSVVSRYRISRSAARDVPQLRETARRKIERTVCAFGNVVRRGQHVFERIADFREFLTAVVEGAEFAVRVVRRENGFEFPDDAFAFPGNFAELFVRDARACETYGDVRVHRKKYGVAVFLRFARTSGKKEDEREEEGKNS